MSRLTEQGRLKIIKANKRTGTFARYNQIRSSLPGYVNPMKGKKRSDLVEYNRKRKESGWYAINNPMKGKHHSAESKKKIVANRDNKAIGMKLKGRVYSFETIKRMQQAHSGSKNPMHGRKRPGSLSGGWKGGITEINHGWRRGTEWKTVRRTIIIRDELTCKKCGVRDVRFDVHHIKPYKKYPEIRFEEDNLITLCKNCHKKQHKGT